MRIVRYVIGGKVGYGELRGSLVYGFRVSPFTHFRGPGTVFRLDGSTYDLGRVKLLAPCSPSKIVCVGLNYRSHATELSSPVPPVPILFLKPPSAVIGPDDVIVLPRGYTRVDYEGELGVIIGRKAKGIPPEAVRDYILGYTCVNDVTERDVQIRDGQWTRAKGYDTFAPVGPWVETDVNPDALEIETRLNGQLRQSGRTSDLIFGVPRLVSFVSGVMTLMPGDIIASGTPSGIGPMKPGDVVEVTIEGIGALRNSVAGNG